MIEGTIVSLVADRGFGFIKASGYQNELFFHANSLVGLEFDAQLLERRVMVEVSHNVKGPRAERVEAAE